MRNRRTDRPSGDVPLRLWAPARFRAAVSVAAATAAGLVPAVAVLPGTAHAAVVPTISVGAAADTAEGDTLRFPVTLSESADADLTVKVSTSSTEADEGADYTGLDQFEVLIPQGETTVTVEVETLPDESAEESPESIGLEIVDPDTATPGTRAASGDIVDAVFTVTPVNGFDEGDEDRTREIDITLNIGFQNTASVAYAVATGDGNAVGNEDFTPVADVLTFTPGQKTKRVAVTILGNDRWQGDRTFTLALSGLTGGSARGMEPRTYIIGDDEQRPVVQSVSQEGADEGSSGITTAEFTVTLSEAADEPIILDVTGSPASEAGVAGAVQDEPETIGGLDYRVPDTVTVPAGAKTATFQADVFGDAVFEKLEVASILVAPRADDPNVTGSPRAGSLAIRNDDDPPTLEFDGFTRPEGTDGVEVGFTVTGEAQDPIRWTGSVAGASDNGTDPAETDDFVNAGLAPFSDLRPGSERLTLGMINLAPGSADEFDETLKATVQLGDADPVSGFATITDADTQKEPRLVVPQTVAVREGSDVTIPVTLDFAAIPDNAASATEKPITVNYTVTPGTAGEDTDYAAASGTLTIEPGDPANITLDTLPDQDTESNENFVVTLNGAVNAVVDGNETTTVTVSDYDPNVTPRVSIGSPGPVPEGMPLRFPLTLDQPTGSPVTVRVSTTGGTATAGADYTELSEEGVTFTPGQTTAVAVVTTNPDGEFEHAAETVTARIADSGAADLGTATATATIIDPALKIGTVSINEDDSRDAVVDMVLNVPLNTPLQAGYELQLGSATTNTFSTISSGTLSYAPGQTSRPITAQLPDGYDVPTFGRMLKVRLFNLNTDSGLPVMGTGEHSTLIKVPGDPDAMPTVTMGSPGAVAEGRPLRFPLTLDRPSGIPITVRVTTEGGTATPGLDYVEAVGMDVTFQPGQTTAVAEIVTNQDGVSEHESEVVHARITNAGLATMGSATTAYGKIVDAALRIGTMAVDENGSGNAVVDMALNVPLDTRLQAGYELLISSATTGVFVPISSGTLTYEPGQTSRQISGPLPGDYDAGTPGRVLKVRLYGVQADNGLQVLGTGEHSSVIGASGEPGAVPRVSLGSPGAVPEGRPLRFPLTLDRPSSIPITVNVSSSAGTASAGTDYAEVFDMPVTFQPGQTTAVAEITTNQDGVFEHDSETVNARITNPGAAALGPVNSSYGKIADPALRIGAMSVDENNSRNAVVDMVLNVPLDTRLQANYELLLGSASTGTFTPIATGTLTYEAGQTSRPITGALPGDYQPGVPDRVLKVRLHSVYTDSGMPVLGTGEHSSVLGASSDPGVVPAVGIGSPGTVPEGRMLRFPLTLDRPSNSPITVRVSTEAGTATPGADYNEISDMSVTFQPGQVTATADVVTHQDNQFEHDSETVNARITNPGSATLGSVTTSYGKIIDPALKIGTMSINENDSRNAVVDMVLNAPLDTRLQANYELLLGSATTGVFTPVTSGTLTYEPGQTTRQISAPLPGDFNVAAPGKMLKVRLYGLSNDAGLQVMGTGEHSAMIGGSGGVPTVAAVSSSPQNEGDGSTQVTFTVQLSGPAPGPVTLDVAAVDESAVRWGSGPGSNDFSVPDEVFIPEGQTQATFMVTINGDRVYERDEQASITVTPRPNDPNVTGPMRQSLLKIYNDDAAPALTFGGFDQTEGVNGSLWFNVDGVAQDPLPWTAALRGASDGTSDQAEATDFDGSGLTLSGTLQPWSNRIDLGTVNLPADSVDEYDETFEASVEFTGQVPVTAYGRIRDSYQNMPPNIRMPEQTTVTEGSPATLPVTLDYTSVPGNTATSTEKVISFDYATSNGSTSGSVTIDPPMNSTEIVIPTASDETPEPDETLTLSISNMRNAERPGPMPTVTIRDAAPSITIGNATPVIEGQMLSFPVRLSRPSATPITLRYSTVPERSSGVPGTDYQPATDATVVVPAGATTAFILVPTFAVGGYDPESRVVHIQVLDPGTGTLDAGAASGEIIDAAIFANTTGPVEEGDSGVRDQIVEVRLSAAMNAAVDVDYSLIADTAVEGVDYDPVSGHLTFQPGETVKQIPVPIRGNDAPSNRNKAFKVRLTNASHAAGIPLNNDGDFPVWIVEDDNAGTVNIVSVSSESRPEGDGVSTVPVTVRLSGPVALDTTLYVGSTGGTAVQGGTGPGESDFSAPQAVQISAGQDTATINVTVNGDGVFEKDEVIDLLVEPSHEDALISFSENPGAVTLTNDDAAPRISFDGFEQSEGTGGIGAWFTVTGDAQDPLPWTAVVEGGSDGTSDPAEAGDFTRDNLTLSGTLAPGGDRIDVGTVNLTQDTADEYDETIKVSVGVQGIGDTTGYGRIRDWNTQLPPKVVAAGPVTVDEAGTATVPVNLDFAAVAGNTATSTEKQITVDYNAIGGTATAGTDFTSTSGTLVFTPPATSQDVTVTTLTDTAVENDETLQVTLSNPSNAEIGGSPATVTIRGDSAVGFQVQPDVTAAEGQGSVAVTVTLARAAAGPVDFTVSTTDDTARRGQTGPGGDDYGSPQPTFTIPQGQTTATFSLPIVDDQVYEEKESATYTVAPAPGETDASGPAQTGVLSIADDDPAPTITLNSVNGPEGGLVDVIATPSGVAEDPIGYLLNFTTGGPGNDPAEPEDYVDSGAPAVLPGGSTGPVLLRSVPLAADTADELTESFTVTATSQAVSGAPPVAAVYGILDDPNDLPPSAVVLPANVREELGYAEVPVVLEFTGGNGATRTDQPVTIYYEVTPGTATSEDFGTDGGSRLYFPAGQNYAVIRVPITNDKRREEDESFKVRLVAADPSGAGIARGEADIVIVDDDRDLPAPSFTVSGDVTAREADASATFAVTLSEPAQGDVDLVVEAQPGTATADDYGTPAAALRIPEGSASGSVTVPIKQDEVYEGDENARVVVSLAAGEQDAAGKPQEGRLLITDDDKAPTITLDPTAATVDEGDTVELTGTVTGTAQRDHEISTAAAAGIAADGEDAGPDDFELDRVKVTVPGGTASGGKVRLGTIEFLDDAVDENTETATISLAGGSRTFRITDDPDDTPPAVSVADASVGESGGTAKVNVRVQFTGGAVSTSRTVTVPWSTADGTADAGKDYTRSSGTATFAPGTDSATISIPILPDTKDEADQTFIVKLGTPSPADARLGAAEAEVVIEDDDKPKAPTLTAPDTSTGEGRITITGTAAPGTKVELLTAQGVSGGSFKVAATTTADDDGAYSFKPNFTKGYRVQVRAGSLTSPVRTVQVRQDPQLTVVSNAKGAATLTVTGDPDEPGQKVTIQRQVKGGWDEVEDGKLGANGKFSVTVKSLKAGNHVFRAVISATPSLGITAGSSPARSVKVK
ncbi:hypothetical protein Ait01nite_094750 [Actinoplanes italicus]|uniref:Calx-beta domain-containing protein n=1 Tax=Actinoplanes italicus TaxID=113567 RepID=A0A2T0KD53_9ACTN|nr:Calx-beta domain-containing protein [Actinoplanes italicus]PRX21230.1 Calx-beta domain-containing protein [Actinoplanes italicus]GIE36430.1 hypothetical protein Ait01nite_094750 [Actinoplanes italicus]